MAPVLKQTEEGAPVGDIRRKAGIGQATFCACGRGAPGRPPGGMRRLKALRAANARLKRHVAGLSLDKEM